MSNTAARPRIEYTSVALSVPGWREIVSEGASACAEHGFDFGIQVHNTAPESQIEEIAVLGIPMSFHAPVLSENQINLAAADPAPSFEAIGKTASLMRRYGAEKAVLHGFNMTDMPIPSFGKDRSYAEAFSAAFRKELALPDSFLCNDFFGTGEYLDRNERVSERLAHIREAYPDLSFLLENDFPAFGAGSIFAEHIVKMGNPICLDSSHLWASSFIFGRDFHREAAAFLGSGLVQMVHLHSSKYDSSIPREKWSDGHLPLTNPNSMDLPRLIAMCRESKALHFVLEINGLSRADIDYVARHLGSDEP